jgi:hypothetical protein
MYFKHFDNFDVLFIIEFWYTKDYSFLVCPGLADFRIKFYLVKSGYNIMHLPTKQDSFTRIKTDINRNFFPLVNRRQGRRGKDASWTHKSSPWHKSRFIKPSHASCHMKGHFTSFQSTPNSKCNSYPSCSKFNSARPTERYLQTV